MKYLLTFDDGCPANMGKSQLTDNVKTFIEERADLLPDASFTKTKLTFTGGSATIEEVKDDYTNFEI